ncbi:YggN family protein [Vibrio genomosp. F6]|uniref:Chemotaxis protein n=1 Tax=Vibrio genomosp. F6 str. FF-238 TaxID=1191298 RepID=A0A1E5CYP6_9VIBR|nr:YggN family protein [Vibrio genomosp. F6]OEE75961.1 chemotaxis protein [Vibrio genomosp. F6 str. FF-238]
MKSVIGVMALTLSSSVYAVQCNVDIENEVHLNGSDLEIYKDGTPKVLINDDNHLYIHGEKIQLDDKQQQAIEEYREKMNAYLPRAKDIANDGLNLANDIIDDVSVSFDNSESFNKVKTALEAFFADVEARYYQGDEFVLQKDAFDSFIQNWQKDFDKAQEVFNSEFFTSAFDAMSEKMKQDGGINFTELANKMAELKEKLAAKVTEQSIVIEKEAQIYCESLDEVAEQEQELHEKIPELKNYQVFTI